MKYKKEDLERFLIAENKSYESVGRLFNVSGSAIRKAALRFGIAVNKKRKINPCETFNKGVFLKPYITLKCLFCEKEFIKYPSHSGKFCSFGCQHSYENDVYLAKWKNGEVSGLIKNGYSMSKVVRKYIFEKYNYKCEKCGWGEVNLNTGLVPLHTHHADGNCQNNRECNIQLLCPNCHSLTENFGSRNKNATNGRSEYFGRKKKK